MSDIIWSCKLVNVADLKQNPNNPKIITELGRKRLRTSVDKFGLAGTYLCNTDLTIIDGHSRDNLIKELKDKKIKQVWVSVPSRPLTQKEYDEFNAIHDEARAGKTDMLMVEEILEEKVLVEYDLDKKEKPEIVDHELKPFVQTHVLLSFAPELMIEIQPLLQKISEVPGVEYEQSSN